MKDLFSAMKQVTLLVKIMVLLMELKRMTIVSASAIPHSLESSADAT
jgi:hypothetical protein